MSPVPNSLDRNEYLDPVLDNTLFFVFVTEIRYIAVARGNVTRLELSHIPYEEVVVEVLKWKVTAAQ